MVALLDVILAPSPNFVRKPNWGTPGRFLKTHQTTVTNIHTPEQAVQNDSGGGAAQHGKGSSSKSNMPNTEKREGQKEKRPTALGLLLE